MCVDAAIRWIGTEVAHKVLLANLCIDSYYCIHADGTVCCCCSCCKAMHLDWEHAVHNYGELRC